MDNAVTKLPGRRLLVGLSALAAVGLLGGYAVAMRARPRPTTISLESAPPEKGSGQLVYVHVGGAVLSPGLYGLRDGARVDDAVRAAGGVLEDADVDGLNLAALLRDGDKILVPVRGAAGAAQATGQGGGGGQSTLVNLNTASQAELETLPGIGPALASRIISHREQKGGFRTVEELMQVSGIGPKKFEALRDLVTV